MRFIAGLAIALGTAALAALIFVNAIASAVIRNSLRDAGFENPSLQVAHLSPSQITLKSLAAGPDSARSVSIERIEATFGLISLLTERRLKTVAIGPGFIRSQLEADGSLNIGGFVWRRSQERQPLPLEALEIEGLDLTFATTKGVISTIIDGNFDVGEGGSLVVRANTAAYSAATLNLQDAEVKVDLILKADGAASLTSTFVGDLSVGDRNIDGLILEIDGKSSSWRALLDADLLAFDLDGVATLRSALPEPAGDNARGAGSIAVEGKIRARVGEGEIAIFSDAASPIAIRSSSGELLLDGIKGAPLFASENGRRKIGLALRRSGSVPDGAAEIAAETSSGGPWLYEAKAVFEEQSISDVNFGRTSASSTGRFDGVKISGTLRLVSDIRRMAIGRLSVQDMPIDAIIEIEANLDSKVVQARGAEGACLKFARTSIALSGQDIAAALSEGEFCGDEGRWLVASYGDHPRAEVQGFVKARSGRLRSGQTRFAGAPPRIDFTAQYDPRAQLTQVSGRLSDGRVSMNGAVLGSNARGVFAARLDAEGLSGNTTIERLLLEHDYKDPFVAPLIAAGTARMADEIIEFEFDAATPEGILIGRGAGMHHVDTGSGSAQFESRKLVFAPGALQPSKLLPSWKGVIGVAAGSTSGVGRFGWGPRPDDFTSSANFLLSDLTFRGPGIAVSQTAGLEGAIELANLSPVTSRGKQTLRIRMIDLDALRLESGIIQFLLPGDGTLQVRSAEFAWFGGTIGAYDAVAPLTSGEVHADLRANGVDLGALLQSVNIDGLSGIGKVEGTLPLVIRGGKANIVGGALSAVGPGRISYTGKAADAASATGENAKLAFEILRDLRFTRLTALIDGPLDGTLEFKILFEGMSDVTLQGGKVTSPVVYRINLEAPILNLIQGARVASDFRLQLERGADAKN